MGCLEPCNLNEPQSSGTPCTPPSTTTFLAAQSPRGRRHNRSWSRPSSCHPCRNTPAAVKVSRIPLPSDPLVSELNDTTQHVDSPHVLRAKPQSVAVFQLVLVLQQFLHPIEVLVNAFPHEIVSMHNSTHIPGFVGRTLQVRTLTV